MRYLWQGNNISQAAALYQDGSTKHATYYSYELGTHRPLAQIQNHQAQYFVLDANGTPEEIYNSSGQIVEALNLETWGKTRIQRKVASGGYQDYQADACPIRFQGQWQDEESGLYYNRYRYYDPDTSQYLSPDPIGLVGGAIPTAYVHQPTGWVDPLGLNARPETAAEWEKRLSTLGPNERYTAARGKLNKVAKKNGWVRDSKLSRINNRDIYSDGEGSLYASDTQHGRFEKLNSHGEHLGEFDIDGMQTKIADTSGRHNCKCG